MRFYFDIHYGGKVYADDEGEEFDTLEEAQAYVLSTTKAFHRPDQRPNRKVMLYARIEITDRQGTSLTVPMANFLATAGGRPHPMAGMVNRVSDSVRKFRRCTERCSKC